MFCHRMKANRKTAVTLPFKEKGDPNHAGKHKRATKSLYLLHCLGSKAQIFPIFLINLYIIHFNTTFS